MLPKQKRITREQFKNTLPGGRSLYCELVSLRIAPFPGETSRFSFVVPKAVSKSAIKRNLLRRRGYSVIEKHLQNIKNAHIYAFFLKKGVEKLKFSEFETVLIDALKKTRLYAQ